MMLVSSALNASSLYVLIDVSTLKQSTFYSVWPLAAARPRESLRHLIHPVYVGQLETTLRDGRRSARYILGLRSSRALLGKL